jgi:hypothetical protein
MFIEFLPNLNIANFSIKTTRNSTNIEIKNKISINGRSLAVTGLSWKPNTLRMGKCEDDWLNFQVGYSTELVEETTTPLPTPNTFSCLACQALLAGPIDIRKTLSLPSDYWYEMTECWACHHEDYTTLSGQDGGIIYAQKGLLLDGLAYYLIHPSHMAEESIMLRLTGREVGSVVFLYILFKTLGNQEAYQIQFTFL